MAIAASRSTSAKAKSPKSDLTDPVLRSLEASQGEAIGGKSIGKVAVALADEALLHFVAGCIPAFETPRRSGRGRERRLAVSQVGVDQSETALHLGPD
jgi:hypothetical protein